MILIADSGSTKTDWCVALNGTPIQRIGTKGLNPFFQTEEDIQRELTATLLPQLPEGKLDAVYFYGAQTSTDYKNNRFCRREVCVLQTGKTVTLKEFCTDRGSCEDCLSFRKIL